MRICGKIMPQVLNKHRDQIPEGAVVVDRSSRWGNPYHLGDYSRANAIALYRIWVEAEIAAGRLDTEELRGKDLVCWCKPLDCHGDYLLEISNA
jgi:Domain of unknown function (DUF4326)